MQLSVLRKRSGQHLIVVFIAATSWARDPEAQSHIQLGNQLQLQCIEAIDSRTRGASQIATKASCDGTKEMATHAKVMG